MTNRYQFDKQHQQHDDNRPVACQVCEAMLPDAVDGMLTEAEQRAFDKHVAGCTVCAQELEEAQRGAAWLGMLKRHAPEPGDALLARILAATSGAQATETEATPAIAAAPVFAPPVVAAPPVWAAAPPPPAQKTGWAVSALTNTWLSVRETLSLEWMKPLLQPRMAMTAAMAFFSIAVTLNLTGVRLNDLSASSFRPSTLRRVVADRSASAVRSFQNMRVVYQAEAQVNDLRTNWQQDVQDRGGEEHVTPQQQPQQQDEPKPRQEKPQGSSRLEFEPVNPQGPGMTRKGA